eukprot:Rmarinus@m.22835
MNSLLRRKSLHSTILPQRIKWAPWRDLTNMMYDLHKTDSLHKCSTLRRLGRIAQAVREERQVFVDQTPLDVGKNAATTCEGVIYAIYSTKGRRVYVGQTIKTAQERFEKHVTDARAERTNQPIHKLIRRFGLTSIHVFPLERLVNASKPTDCTAFRLRQCPKTILDRTSAKLESSGI